MINDLKKSNKRKIYLTIKINLLSKYSDEKLLAHSKSDNEEIMTVLVQASLNNLFIPISRGIT